MQYQHLLLLITSAYLTALTAATAVLRPRQGGNGNTVLGTLSTWTATACAGAEAQDPIDLVLLYAFQCESLPGGIAAAALYDEFTGVAYHVNLYTEPGCEGDYLTLEDGICSDAELMPGEPPRWAAYQVVMPPIDLAGTMKS